MQNQPYKGGAQPGNKSNEKLRSQDLRKEAYRQYMEHLAQGHSKRTWYFEHPELTLSWQSMEKYIKDYSHEFSPVTHDIAMAKGEKIWEGICCDSAIGKNKKANTASLQMVMRNKFGWDKQQDETKNKEAPNENALQLQDENLQLRNKIKELENAIQSQAGTKLHRSDSAL